MLKQFHYLIPHQRKQQCLRCLYGHSINSTVYNLPDRCVVLHQLRQPITFPTPKVPCPCDIRLQRGRTFGGREPLDLDLRDICANIEREVPCGTRAGRVSLRPEREVEQGELGERPSGVARIADEVRVLRAREGSERRDAERALRADEVRDEDVPVEVAAHGSGGVSRLPRREGEVAKLHVYARNPDGHRVQEEVGCPERVAEALVNDGDCWATRLQGAADLAEDVGYVRKVGVHEVDIRLELGLDLVNCM